MYNLAHSFAICIHAYMELALTTFIRHTTSPTPNLVITLNRTSRYFAHTSLVLLSLRDFPRALRVTLVA